MKRNTLRRLLQLELALCKEQIYFAEIQKINKLKVIKHYFCDELTFHVERVCENDFKLFITNIHNADSREYC